MKHQPCVVSTAALYQADGPARERAGAGVQLGPGPGPHYLLRLPCVPGKIHPPSLRTGRHLCIGDRGAGKAPPGPPPHLTGRPGPGSRSS